MPGKGGQTEEDNLKLHQRPTSGRNALGQRNSATTREEGQSKEATRIPGYGRTKPYARGRGERLPRESDPPTPKERRTYLKQETAERASWTPSRVHQRGVEESPHRLPPQYHNAQTPNPTGRPYGRYVEEPPAQPLKELTERWASPNERTDYRVRE